jgi:hypothetical protein
MRSAFAWHWARSLDRSVGWFDARHYFLSAPELQSAFPSHWPKPIHTKSALWIEATDPLTIAMAALAFVAV